MTLLGRLFFRRLAVPGFRKEAAVYPPGEDAWRVVGAAVKGVSHERMGLPCQDAQEYRVLPNGVLLIAVADGAGSASLSELGARLAVSRAMDTLESRIKRHPPCTGVEWENVIRRAFYRTFGALVRLAEAQRKPIREYATTLTCVAATRQILAVGQIGDGAVIGRNPAGPLFSATRAQKGEYANETNFLTQVDALKKVEVWVYDQPVDALAVTSDGLIRLAIQLQSGEPYAPFFDPLFAYARTARVSPEATADLAGFLSSERVSARTEDDKTLVIAVRADGSKEIEPSP